MGPKRLWRKHGQATTDADLDRARSALDEAREQRAEHTRKRMQEQEGLIKPMERLARENHLAGWVLDIISGDGGAQ